MNIAGPMIVGLMLSITGLLHWPTGIKDWRWWVYGVCMNILVVAAKSY